MAGELRYRSRHESEPLLRYTGQIGVQNLSLHRSRDTARVSRLVDTRVEQGRLGACADQGQDWGNCATRAVSQIHDR